MDEPTRVAVGDASGRELSATIYLRGDEADLRTAVLFLHGGGWRGGSPDGMRRHAEVLAAQGFTGIAPEYRLLPEAPWPAQIHDVKAAIRWTRANANALGIDPGRIAIQGFSAGAHLALIAAGTPGLPEFEGESGTPGVSSEVNAVVAMFPPTGFSADEKPEPGVQKASALLGEGADAAAAQAISPITYVSAAFPPVFFIHGTSDHVTSFRSSVRMFEALKAAGAPVDLHLYSGLTHEFQAGASYHALVQAEAAFFLRRTLSEKDAIEEELLAASMFARSRAERAREMAAVSGGQS